MNFNDINWLGHASFFFTDALDNKVYFVDPFQLGKRKLEKADLIFITHAHPDHFSQEDIEKIITDKTTIIAPIDILEKINIPKDRKMTVLPNNNYEAKGFKFSTTPAYNNHPDRLNFHPKVNNWVGYIFELNGKKIYHGGDTDFIEEMKSLKNMNLDIAMLPMDGIYCMGAEEMANAANAISAKMTIPMHYKRQNPSNYNELEEKLKELVTNSKVVVLEEFT